MHIKSQRNAVSCVGEKKTVTWQLNEIILTPNPESPENITIQLNHYSSNHIDLNMKVVHSQPFVDNRYEL